jgi:radical SAM enzyme (TIGR01210 family)
MIPRQLAAALAGLTADRLPAHLKLYNGGSFFDPQAIPPADHAVLARQVAGFERLTVECHPSLVGRRVLRFRDQVEAAAAETGRRAPRLEIAVGLETAHPGVLARLNKRLTLGGFQRAAEFLRRHELALRVFVLVKPPFLDEPEAAEWARKSVEFAFDCGATAVALIPTRFGNGALEVLASQGEFTPPRIEALEAALDQGIRLGRGRVFADLWNLADFSRCPQCLPARRARLEHLNLSQTTPPPVPCQHCGHALESNPPPGSGHSP